MRCTKLSHGLPHSTHEPTSLCSAENKEKAPPPPAPLRDRPSANHSCTAGPARAVEHDEGRQRPPLARDSQQREPRGPGGGGADEAVAGRQEAQVGGERLCKGISCLWAVPRPCLAPGAISRLDLTAKFAVRLTRPAALRASMKPLFAAARRLPTLAPSSTPPHASPRGLACSQLQVCRDRRGLPAPRKLRHRSAATTSATARLSISAASRLPLGYLPPRRAAGHRPSHRRSASPPAPIGC